MEGRFGRKRVGRWLRGFAVTAVALYALLVLALFAGQRALLYPAPRARGVFPDGDGGFVRDAETGALLLYRPGPAGAPTVVYFHGNGEQIANEQWVAEEFSARGLGFLAVEYPGYGFAPGSPTEEGLYAAAETALGWLRARRDGPVVLMGRSLGTGVAVEMARRGRGARVVLVSAYTSIPDAAARVFRWVPARWLVRDRFESLRKAPEVRVPVLLVHGTRDGVVPYAMGEQLVRAFPSARLITVDGAGHDDVLERDGRVLDAVAAFARGG